MVNSKTHSDPDVKNFPQNPDHVTAALAPTMTERRQTPGEPSGIQYGRRKDDAAKKRKAQFFVTVCHWSMVILLAINLLTGMRLGWGYVESWLGGPNGTWSAILNALAPKGTLFGTNLITLHVLSAWLTLMVSGIYVAYLLRSGASRRLRLTAKEFRTLTQVMRIGGFWRHKSALWSANLMVYWLAFAAIGILFGTGIALYQTEWPLFQVLGGYQTVRFLHGLVAYLLIPYAVLHAILEWGFGTFWSIFKAKWYSPHVKAGCIGMAITLPIVAGVYAWGTQPTTLLAKRIPQQLQAPILDGNPVDPVWRHAKTVELQAVKGLHSPGSHVDISVKALHDDAHIYFQVQWTDPDVSAKRWPLIKTPQGWKILQTAMAQSNESEYYEDKLAMYITDVRNGSCAATCHLAAGAEAGVAKGNHYTAGEIGDLWHWKFVRTNAMGDLLGEPGYMDDQHFGPPSPMPPLPLKKRYTAGYKADPSRGGGYRENFIKRDPDKPLAETSVRPIKLPPTRQTASNPNPATSEDGVMWWIHEAQGLPYTPEADTYPVGTIIPNILVAPFQGDRADVRAKASWKDGKWTLEIRRRLDTKSPYDVAFRPEKPVYLSISPFNRTEIQHGEHIKPIRLVLQP